MTITVTVNITVNSIVNITIIPIGYITVNISIIPTVNITVYPVVNITVILTINKPREEYSTALQQGSRTPETELYFRHMLLCCLVLGVNGCRIEQTSSYLRVNGCKFRQQYLPLLVKDVT